MGISAYPIEEELDSTHLEEDHVASRSELEWRLHHRGRFAPEHHKVPVATLQRLDAMFDSLPSATTIEDAVCVVRTAFASEAEQRAALVPLLPLLSPIFDEKMPTPDIIRLIAHHEMRRNHSAHA